MSEPDVNMPEYASIYDNKQVSEYVRVLKILTQYKGYVKEYI